MIQGLNRSCMYDLWLLYTYTFLQTYRALNWLPFTHYYIVLGLVIVIIKESTKSSTFGKND